MTPEQEAKVLSSLYDRLYDAVTYAPDGKSGAFPKNVYFQMTKNEVLNPDDFKNMVSPVNPKGDQRMTEYYSAMVDKLPTPGALWSDSGNKLSAVLEDILAQANTASKPDKEQQKTYDLAYNFLNTRTTTTDFKGVAKDKIDPSAIAIAYDQARAAYVAAISGYRTAYNGYDLTKIDDQRKWNAAAPVLQNLVDQTWNAWGRSGKEEVEEAQQALASTINNAISHAIEEAKRLSGAQFRLPSAIPGGLPWLPSYAMPTNWADPATTGIALSFSSDYLNETSSSTAHTYGVEAGGSYGLFHASGEVEGKHVNTNSHMDAQKLTLAAELIAVNIMRPWFNPLLFGMNEWWVKGYNRNGLSNGDAAKPAGKIPLVPTGFVVARNVSITADFSEKDKTTISNAVNSSVSGGWGPFTLKAKYGYSSDSSDAKAKLDGGKLIFPGLQLIAWISTVTPASPPLDSR